MSELSEEDLEDEVTRLIEAGADMVPPPSLPTIADMAHI